MPATASSWLSNTMALPVNFQMDSSTPAVFTIQPSSAILPNNTAKPPSCEMAFSLLRIQPFTRSLSTLSQRQSCENACVVRIPAGPARKNLCNSSSWLRMMSYWSSCSPIVKPNTVWVFLWIKPARSNSPNKPIMPPAR